MILPTFSAHLDVGDNLAQVRIFKDTGCQRTFICSSLANALDLPKIERNIPLTHAALELGTISGLYRSIISGL